MIMMIMIMMTVTMIMMIMMKMMVTTTKRFIWRQGRFKQISGDVGISFSARFDFLLSLLIILEEKFGVSRAESENCAWLICVIHIYIAAKNFHHVHHVLMMRFQVPEHLHVVAVHHLQHNPSNRLPSSPQHFHHKVFFIQLNRMFPNVFVLIPQS